MYSDEHYQKSKASYDGKLIPLEDAFQRYERDRFLKKKYLEAETSIDKNQMTWEDVEEKLK